MFARAKTSACAYFADCHQGSLEESGRATLQDLASVEVVQRCSQARLLVAESEDVWAGAAWGEG